MGSSKHEVAGLTWDRVKDRLAGGAAAILPIGAGSKQHGLHLPMATDQIFARYFARALADRIDALIWPTLSYAHTPPSSPMPAASACPAGLSKPPSRKLPMPWLASAQAAPSSSTRD